MSIVTTDFSDFGYRELAIAAQLLTALSNGECPNDFDLEGVTVNLNRSSGYVFLSNSEYQCAMMNGDKLESFYTSPYAGIEGFWEDIVDLYPEMHPDDQEWLRGIADWYGREIPGLTDEH